MYKFVYMKIRKAWVLVILTQVPSCLRKPNERIRHMDDFDISRVSSERVRRKRLRRV